MSDAFENRKRVTRDAKVVTNSKKSKVSKNKQRNETESGVKPNFELKAKRQDSRSLDVEETDAGDLEIQLETEDLNSDDVFRLQFDYELNPEMLAALSSKPRRSTCHSVKWSYLGNVLFYQPDLDDKDAKDRQLLPTSSTIDKTTVYAVPRNNPSIDTPFDLSSLHVKAQLVKNIIPACQRFLNQDITPFQKELFRIVSNYQDLYYTERSFGNGEEIRLVYCVHALNHALKTRQRIIQNNAKISKGKDNDYRDHGLVRPKVLILVPFRDAALRVVKMLMAILLGEGGNVMNKKRFLDSYSGETIRFPERNPKPPDYQQIFYGNTDDNFKLGISLTKKSLNLYADFYACDIIVASPLGLRMLIGSEGEASRDYDFLSSIELLIMDQTEIFLMQNWEHVVDIISHLHLVPKESHGTDLGRVRMWCLNGWSKHYLQLLTISSHPLPEITSLFNRTSNNFAGKAIISNPIIVGSISQLIVPVPQLFHEIQASSVVDAIGARFDRFTSKFLPQFKDPLMKHTLVYIPSYFDFVKIRNYFKKQDISFAQICEYSMEGKIARARDLFYHGEVHFLLYSERFHFFRRIRVKGIRHILFYQPPAFPHFYSEMSNFLKDFRARGEDYHGQSDLSITVLYTKYDVTQLASIVGTERATRMLASDKTVHMFMTDDSM